VVVGGGIAGLSATWRLRRAGFDDFMLLELEDRPGGTSLWTDDIVSSYPWGAHYLPVPRKEQRAVCALLEEMGVVVGYAPDGRAVPAEDHLLRAPEERVFYRGAWTEGLWPVDATRPGDGAERRRFEELVRALGSAPTSDGRRPFALPVAASSRDPALLALDRISMAQWLDQHDLRSMAMRWYVEYATRDDFGASLENTSAWAGLHYFAARSGADGEPADYLTWPEGNGFLVRHLAKVTGEERRRGGCVVLSVEPDVSGGARVRYLEVATGAVRVLRARRVICAVPRFVARRIVPALRGETGGFLTSPWVVANLVLDGDPSSRGFPLCWDNVLYESESLGYVVATHQSDRANRDSVWTWYRPFIGADPAAERARVLAVDWGGWRDTVMADLVRAHPDLAEHVVRMDVRRWGHGMVRPEPGFIWGGARERAAAPVGAVHFAHADLGGLPLFEEAQWHGVRAAEEVLAALGLPAGESLL
jgi:phytoene dehydrogenase-like protein